MSFFVLDCSSTHAPLRSASFHPRNRKLCCPARTKPSPGTSSSYDVSLLVFDPALPKSRVVLPGAPSCQHIDTNPEQSVRYVSFCAALLNCTFSSSHAN